MTPAEFKKSLAPLKAELRALIKAGKQELRAGNFAAGDAALDKAFAAASQIVSLCAAAEITPAPSRAGGKRRKKEAVPS